ncbi:MAG TPA: histidine kinase [Streptosporangiaceae bacterium]|jgi:two-component system sensor histidine kinase DesK
MRLPPGSLRRPALAGPYLMLVAVHLPILAEAPLYATFGSLGGIRPSGHPWLVALSGAMIFGLQLRHSLALARGERPRGGVWTLLALAALAYAPLPLLGLNWISVQVVLLASVPMVLDGWLAAMAIAGPCAYIGVQLAAVFPAHPGPARYADYIYWVTNYAATFTVVPAALYASARLVRVAGELRGTQIALARAAAGRERLRVSRDLHDLVGHSLSAMSLKGDLAIRLLPRDGQAAVAEIQGLTEVAREALAGLRAITAGGPEVTLAGELGSARALLAAAGVAVRVRGDISAIPPAAGEVLAWAVREGSTNIIRHATAATAVITVRRAGGLARLEILNDGAHPAAGRGGYGLSGLAARIQELSGSLSHGRLHDDRFLLTAQVPVTEELHWTASGCSSPKTST